MNLNGEKKLEQLFLEMRSEDSTLVSSFQAVLNRQSGTIRERRLSLVLTAILALIAIALLAVFAVKKQTTVQLPPDGRAVVAPPNEEHEKERTPVHYSNNHETRTPPGTTRHRRPRRSSDQLMLAIKSLSDWRSPTASLLTFPGEDWLKGLPKLGESLERSKSSATDQN